MRTNFDYNHGVWEFSRNPFPAYRAELVYGRRKRDRALLPVLGDLYPMADLQDLPDNQFRVIKTKKKGTICIVPRPDNTDRYLAFITEYGGFRGWVEILDTHTTGRIIASCYAASACESGYSIAVILDIGQQVVFHTTGRGQDDYVMYRAEKEEITCTSYTREEWEAMHEDFSDVEEL